MVVLCLLPDTVQQRVGLWLSCCSQATGSVVLVLCSFPDTVQQRVRLWLSCCSQAAWCMTVQEKKTEEEKITAFGMNLTNLTICRTDQTVQD